MIQENLHNETEIRRFLLGEMPPDARTALEEKFFADESLFEQIRLTEDELIESYVRGTLSTAEKANFEREFLSTELRRKRVRFAGAMLDKLAGQNEIAAAKKTETAAVNPSVWDKLANFFNQPKLAFGGAAFALLILIFGGWLLLRNPSRADIAGQITPTPTRQIVESPPTFPSNQNAAIDQDANAAPNIPANKNDAPNANRARPTPSPAPDKQKETSAAVSPVLALFTGATRAGGKTSELSLPKNAPGARIELNLESRNDKIYAVEIVNPDGEPIFRNSKLKARNSKINFFVPSQKLQTGDYIVRLSALNPPNENESIADYTFRVNRK